MAGFTSLLSNRSVERPASPTTKENSDNMRLPWQKKRPTARVIEPITKGQGEHGGREHKHLPSCVTNPLCPDYQPYERDQMVDTKNTPNYMTLTGADKALPAGLEATTETRDGKLMAISVQPSPMIHQITAPIIWRDSPIGTRFGPGRCNLECTEVHAYAEKVNATTIAYERPCEPADMGAAEWRARQKR